MRTLAGIFITGVLAVTLAPLAPQAIAQSNRASEEIQCGSAVLHYAERGFAFECSDTRNENFFIFVVNPAQGYERVEEVISALREFNTRTTTGSGRTRNINGLWVKYRNAGGPAQAVCADIWHQLGSNVQCKVAVDVGFR